MSKLTPFDLEETGLETTLTIIKSASDIFGSLVPILGPTLSKAIEYRLSDIQHRKFVEYIQAQADYLKNIPESLLNSDEFMDELRKEIGIYLNESSLEKRKLLINLNRSFFTILRTSDKNIFNINRAFNDLFSQLSIPALDCLLNFQDKFPLNATRYDIIQYFNERQGILGRHCFLELETHALLEEKDVFEMPPTFCLDKNQKRLGEPANDIPLGQRCYKITPLAGVFIDWLKMDISKIKE